MDFQYPIHTVETECQDCYKCVRQCPVKAIRVENNRAAVVPELCIACGHCVAICPAQAKHIRSDLVRARHLLARKERVYVSLAPSWASEFPHLTAERLIAAIRRLGIHAVSETALGAQDVSAAVAAQLATQDGGVIYSSACPVAVEYLHKYMPEQAAHVSPLLSPLLAHCKRLRRTFGEEIGIIFVGPCIGKKIEADRHPELLDLALTFDELRRWFLLDEINPAASEPHGEDVFVPERAREGAIYPVEGGMAETIRNNTRLLDSNKHVRYVTLTGVSNMQAMLQGLTVEQGDAPLFVELLACPGGCVHGPVTDAHDGAVMGRFRVLERAPYHNEPVVRDVPAGLLETTLPGQLPRRRFAENEITVALRMVGKTCVDDELNCGGCGYETCRAFAAALLEDKAEPGMCLSFLRRQAQKKANALLRCMPSGVVIVDANLTIVECNEPFARMFGEDALCAFEASPGLAGAQLERTVPFADLFSATLRTGTEIRRDIYRVGDRLLNLTIFNIEPHQVVGALVVDVTGAEVRREQIARRAHEVIRKNMATVQEIACRLGENMADTEILLRNIATDFAPDNPDGATVAELHREEVDA